MNTKPEQLQINKIPMAEYYHKVSDLPNHVIQEIVREWKDEVSIQIIKRTLSAQLVNKISGVAPYTLAEVYKFFMDLYDGDLIPDRNKAGNLSIREFKQFRRLYELGRSFTLAKGIFLKFRTDVTESHLSSLWQDFSSLESDYLASQFRAAPSLRFNNYSIDINESIGTGEAQIAIMLLRSLKSSYSITRMHDDLPVGSDGFEFSNPHDFEYSITMPIASLPDLVRSELGIPIKLHTCVKVFEPEREQGIRDIINFNFTDLGTNEYIEGDIPTLKTNEQMRRRKKLLDSIRIKKELRSIGVDLASDHELSEEIQALQELELGFDTGGRSSNSESIAKSVRDTIHRKLMSKVENIRANNHSSNERTSGIRTEYEHELEDILHEIGCIVVDLQEKRGRVEIEDIDYNEFMLNDFYLNRSDYNNEEWDLIQERLSEHTQRIYAAQMRMDIEEFEAEQYRLYTVENPREKTPDGIQVTHLANMANHYTVKERMKRFIKQQQRKSKEILQSS